MIAINRFAALIATAAGAGLVAQAAFAGPGCMGNQQHMVRGYYPYGGMNPQAAYRPGPPPAYGVASAPNMRMMAPPYQWPLPAQRGNPRAVTAGAARPPVEATRDDSSVRAASSESESDSQNVTVRIDGMRFEPASITVEPGTTVTWVHGSSMPHTVSGNGDGPRSSTLYGGQQYSHTFDAAGRYDYSCDFHPSMKGDVIVEATGRDT